MSANDQPEPCRRSASPARLSIGLGGIVGGGFFATYGLTIVGAKGGTPLAFVIGGLIAIFTAYSYVGLTIRYPGPGGTATFIREAFGGGLLAASVNVLLTLSYIAVMGVYAMALAAYTVPYLPEASRALATQLIASFAIIVLGLVNFMGASLMTRLEAIFNIGKLGVLSVFIVAGLVVGQFEWRRLSPAEWAPTSTIVASGMLGFLAYEGFELDRQCLGQHPRSKSGAADRIPRMRRGGDRDLRARLHRRDRPPLLRQRRGGPDLRDFRSGGKLSRAGRLRDDVGRGDPRLGIGDQCRLFRRQQASGDILAGERAAVGVPAEHSRQVGGQPADDRGPRPSRRQRARPAVAVGGDQRRLPDRLCRRQYRGGQGSRRRPAQDDSSRSLPRSSASLHSS